jgi:nitrogen fixation-related uncharacterized protein|tara:strand:- start:55 stop:519 length:465 start_codon:yes stop_codon:yes gene_type:complete
MPTVLKRTLIFLTLMLAGVALYAFWYGISADKYDETAVPYFEKHLTDITSWKYSKLKPLLTPQAQTEFETKAGRATFLLFTQLGQFQSSGKPQFGAKGVEFSEGLGDVDIVSYTVPVVFDTGPAVIKANLVINGDSYIIQHIGISSAVFAETTE